MQLEIGEIRLTLAAGVASVTAPSRLSEGQLVELREGPARSLELFGQDYLVLHGSCVCLGGFAVSFVGMSGAGKSTLAAALSLRNWRLIADGMTAVHPELLNVFVGQPRTKLDDQSLASLHQIPSQFVPVHPESTKRYFPVPHVGNEQVPPLRLVLAVEDSDRTEIVPLAGADAVIALLANIYMGFHLPKALSQALLQRAVQLISSGVHVAHLRRPRELRKLQQVVDCLEVSCRAFATPGSR